MPVKLFRKELRIVGKKEEDLLALEDQINAFEKEIEETRNENQRRCVISSRPC
jgi:hypothetical protein